MFNRKEFDKIKKRWHGYFQANPKRMKSIGENDTKDLISMVDDLRHQLANHLDDESTVECPGCYMERTWEDQIKARNKFIRKLIKLHKNVLENGSSHAFFIMQQAYKSEGELGWDEGKALFDNMIKVARNIKDLAAKEIK